MHSRHTLVLTFFVAIACRNEAPPTSPAASDSSIQSREIRVRWSVSRVDLGTLGGASSFATDVSNGGIVVGWSLNTDGVSRAFRWTTADGMVDLGALPGDDWSRAISINENAEILGVSGATESGETTPVMWTSDGTIAPLPIALLPNASVGEPTDFNTSRQVVGWDVVGFQHAWSWTESRGKHDITATVPDGFEGTASQINSSGTVAGTNKASVCGSAVLECWRAFAWTYETGYHDIGTPRGDPNVAVTGLGLNNAGTIVGWTLDARQRMRPYRWNRGTGMVPLRAPAAPAYAMSVNARGVIVGAAWTESGGAIQPAAWTRTGAFVPLAPGDVNPGVAVAINDVDAIVGWSSLDCCGAENRATLWRIGAVTSVVAAAVTHAAEPSTLPEAPINPGTAETCLADVRALVSRAALFACVAGGRAVKQARR